MRKGNFRFAAFALGLSVMLAMPAGPLAEYAAAQTQPAGAATPMQVPQPQANSVNWPGAGYGVGALFCNVLYIPAKLVYALLGGIVGGGTFLVTAGNSQAANTVWRSALGGDYVVTPQMLAGQEPINFSGPTETPPEGPSSSSSSGSVAPIAPLPQAGSSASASSSAGGQPLDHGSGPAGGSAPNSNVE
ncbi:hypothetical protein [Candidatus Binatus sp.]|uniref:hypothetical protein n=1 Tax=Candidatus Binatus sp. TaxID=2811406 RepID=UPI002F9490E1